jgi:hypothetical protein
VSNGVSGRKPSPRRARALSLGLVFVFVTVLAAGIHRLLYVVLGDSSHGWSDALAAGVPAAVGATCVVSWENRFPGGRRGQQLVQRAIRRAELPDDGDPVELRAGLLHVKRRLRFARWSCYGVPLLVGGVWILLIPRGATGDGSWWLVLLGCVALPAALLGVLRWQDRRIDRLLAELEHQPAE